MLSFSQVSRLLMIASVTSCLYLKALCKFPARLARDPASLGPLVGEASTLFT